MGVKVEMFHVDRAAELFEGVAFQNRMTDKKLGAFCRGAEFCLVVGGGLFHGGLRDIVALGRWNGTCYSVLNRVPLPFLMNPYQGISGKSAVLARNIVNRLSGYMNEPEKVLFREYLLEEERCGVSYHPY